MGPAVVVVVVPLEASVPSVPFVPSDPFDPFEAFAPSAPSAPPSLAPVLCSIQLEEEPAFAGEVDVVAVGLCHMVGHPFVVGMVGVLVVEVGILAVLLDGVSFLGVVVGVAYWDSHSYLAHLEECLVVDQGVEWYLFHQG
jgi:hypothetical protein